VEGHMLKYELNIDNNKQQFLFLCLFREIPVIISRTTEEKDYLYNDAEQCLQWYLIILTLKDVFMHNIEMIYPNLFNHIHECIYYILKTLILMSTKANGNES